MGSADRGPGSFEAARRFTPARAARVQLLLLAILLAAAALSLMIGSSGVGLRDLPALLSGTASAETRTILADVRLPRVLLAVAVGAALAAAGAALQSVLRNPLADPYVLGLSGGAGLGAILWTSLTAGAAAGAGALAVAFRPVAAFAGSVLAVLGLLALARLRGRRAPETMLLMGAVLNATFIALILFVVTIADIGRYQGVMYWLVGSLTPPGGTGLAAVGVCVAAGIAVLTLLGGPLNLLSVGEESAAQLGAAVARVRLHAILASCLITAAAVSVAGLVGFVGLIVPHAARVLCGPDNRLLVPASALLGGAFLAIADTIARTAIAPAQVPVGVITALAGGPFFLWIFTRRDRESEP